MKIILLGIFALITMVSVFSLCVAAGRADRWAERMRIEKKQREDHKLCAEVSCKNCDQNDWCGFSELKKVKEA